MKPGSAHVPKLPGAYKTPAIKGVKMPSATRAGAGHGSTSKPNGSTETHRYDGGHPNAHPGSATPSPKAAPWPKGYMKFKAFKF
jgi:hypothetical protein